MYQLMDASLHAETAYELQQATAALASPAALESLRQRQARACQRFCLDTDSPCNQVVDLIDGNLGLPRAAAVSGND